jgi:hypothetical protein
MGKKCVLRAKPVLITLTIAIAVGLQWSDANLSAQSPDPLTLPRLAFSDFTYLGGFRLPNTAQGGDFSYGGSHMAFNPARNSLFVNSLHSKVAEVTIPAPVNTSDRSLMSFASYLQPFSDPSEGHLSDIGHGTLLSGLLVQGGRLYATGSIYYDALNTQVLSHFSHSTNLAEQSFVGMSQVWDTGKAGFVGGYMSNIPSEWQSLLGGPALTGQCCIPIVTRTSFGPSAFGFNPAAIGNNTSVPASPLLYYTKEHATLGAWEGSTEMYGAATLMGGAAVIAGTRTALFVGRIGVGAYCYGYGVTDPALGGTKAADGQMNCYDPTNAAKGTHGYPYRYQIWAYDLADFAAVKAGAKAPWQVVPYGIWPFELPTPEKTVQIGGVAYDAERQLLYVSQMFADLDGCCERRPIIHTLKINAPSSTTPPPSSTAPPPPSTTVSLVPDASAPKAPGTVIRWTATATGGKAPYEYRWAAYASGTWSALSDWSTSQTFDWQPTTAAPDARIAVWVRTAPGTTSSGDITVNAIAAVAEYPFAIVAASPEESSAPPSAISSLTLTTNLAAPQPAASTIVWTATPAGGSGALVYKWFVTSDGVSWNAIGSWGSSNQFSWTPTVASPNYRVSAWVKHASNPKDEWEATSERPFAIGAAAPASTPVASIALTTSLPAPQPAGSTIVWTATPTGGTGALVYKWFVTDNGVTWNAIGSWTSSNQFSWTPTVANANHRVSAWVKRASNPKDEWEASSELPFPITEPTFPVASVALTTSLPAPQPAGSTIVWTATPTGGTGPLVYKWFVTDNGVTWNAIGSWTSSNQFSWTPTVVNANHRVSAWVKRASNPKDEWEASSEQPFPITEPSFPVDSVALTTSLPAPQPAGSTIVWTATATGGTGALVYKWFVTDNGVTWNAIGSWTSSNQFSWTPTVANANHRVSAWVKRASNPKDEWEASSEQPFAITEPSFPVSSVALTADLPAPQEVSSTIVWTATPTGGTGALVYKWFVSNDGGTSVGSWTSSNEFTWTPTLASGNYVISVWVKRATNPVDGAEASAQQLFAIQEPVTSVALTTNLASPQPLSSTIEWTATPTGGTGDALVYKWFMSADDGVTWTAAGPWAVSNRLNWTPTAVNPKYRVTVWVKHATDPSDYPEASAQRRFAIKK